MPDNWKGCCNFNTKTRILKFTFSTSDVYFMDEIISLLGLYLDSCRMCEVYYEYWDYSKLYVLKDKHLTLENDKYITTTPIIPRPTTDIPITTPPENAT